MTTAIGLLLLGAGVLLLVGAVKNRSPWGLLLSALDPTAEVQPIDPG